MKTLLLCADDVGLSRGIDEAVLRLAQAGRLSATSAIVNAPAWPQDAAALAQAPLALGLHLNLSEGRPLSPQLAALWPQCPPLPQLIMRAHLGQLPLAAIEAELACQTQAFVAAAGRPPEHIDGHQHVHHLPGIGAIVQRWLLAHPGASVRHTGQLLGPGSALKRWLIERTGGARMGRLWQRSARAQNRSLLGAYNFQTPDYRALMQGWLARLPAEGGMIFCHPGPDQADRGDAIGAARAREAAYLASNAFIDDLAAAGVVLQLKTRRSSAG